MAAIHQYQMNMIGVERHHSYVLHRAMIAYKEKLGEMNKNETSDLKNEINMLQTKLARFSCNQQERDLRFEKSNQHASNQNKTAYRYNKTVQNSNNKNTTSFKSWN